MLCALWGLPVFSHATEKNCIKSDFVIAIDSGHSKANPGAISASGIGEYFFNHHIAQLLLEELVSHGFSKVFLISQDGEGLGLDTRTRIALEKKANVLLSIHHDSVQPRYLSKWECNGRQLYHCERFRGYSLFYSSKNEKAEESLILAQAVGAKLRKNGFVASLHHAEKIKGENRPLVDRERGIFKFDNLVVLKTAKMPAILVECGIIVNKDEETSLGDPAYQRMFVTSIREAVEEVCEQGNS
jgi:N-acetylmuramoyl-L-alanine amidase